MSDDDHRGVPRPETAGPERRDTPRADADGSADPDADRALIARRVAAFMAAINTPTEQPADREDPL